MVVIKIFILFLSFTFAAECSDRNGQQNPIQLNTKFKRNYQTIRGNKTYTKSTQESRNANKNSSAICLHGGVMQQNNHISRKTIDNNIKSRIEELMNSNQERLLSTKKKYSLTELNEIPKLKALKSSKTQACDISTQPFNRTIPPLIAPKPKFLAVQNERIPIPRINEVVQKHRKGAFELSCVEKDKDSHVKCSSGPIKDYTSEPKPAQRIQKSTIEATSDNNYREMEVKPKACNVPFSSNASSSAEIKTFLRFDLIDIKEMQRRKGIRTFAENKMNHKKGSCDSSSILYTKSTSHAKNNSSKTVFSKFMNYFVGPKTKKETNATGTHNKKPELSKSKSESKRDKKDKKVRRYHNNPKVLEIENQEEPIYSEIDEKSISTTADPVSIVKSSDESNLDMQSTKQARSLVIRQKKNQVKNNLERGKCIDKKNKRAKQVTFKVPYAENEPREQYNANSRAIHISANGKIKRKIDFEQMDMHRDNTKDGSRPESNNGSLARNYHGRVQDNHIYSNIRP